MFGRIPENFFHNLFQGGENNSNSDDDWFFRPPQSTSSTTSSFAVPPRHIPPASSLVRRQLPKIRVTPNDLVEICNDRECCICTECIHVSDIVTRLPCAHLFHPECIDDWLARNCMCPICRYELPTDDAAFESGRLERMRHRKPRFAQYEVQRMTVAELKKYAKTAIPRSIIDKQSLIEFLVQQNCIELIRNDSSNNDQVEYRLSELRSCSIKRLYSIMNDAGVFFDRKHVVEKEDMVRIFVASGRLLVLPEPTAVPPEVETVHSDDEDGEESSSSILRDSRTNGDLVMEEATFIGREEERGNGEEPTGASVSATQDAEQFVQDNDTEYHADAPGNAASASLIETMMEQVATLGIRELASLQETISQLIEDRTTGLPTASR